MGRWLHLRGGNGLLVVHQSEQVSQKHGDGDFPDGRHKDRGHLLHLLVDEVGLAGEVDDNGASLDVFGRELVGLGWHPGDDDITFLGTLFQGLGTFLGHVLLVSQPVTSVVGLDVVDVHGVDGGPVVGQQGGQGSADDFGSVHHSHGLTVESVTVVQHVVVGTNVLQDLDDGQGGAGQDRLHCLLLVQVSHIVVHVGNVLEVQALDVLVHRHTLLQVLVLLVAVDREVDNHTVDVVVVVALVDLLLQLVLAHLDQLVLEPQRVGRLSGPGRIHHGSRVVVG